MPRGVGATHRPIVLGAAAGRAHDQGFAEAVAQSLELVRAAGWMRIDPVRRQAIWAGEKFGQREASAGTSHQLRRKVGLMHTLQMKRRPGAGRNGREGGGSDQGLGPNHQSFMAMPVSSAIRAPRVITCTQSVCGAPHRRGPLRVNASRFAVGRNANPFRRS